jgi:uncharacterized membrane protein
MPHTPPPPDNGSEITVEGIIFVVVCGCSVFGLTFILVHLKTIVLTPLATHFSNLNETDIFIIGYTLLLLSLLGFASEIYAKLSGYDVVKVPAFLVVVSIFFVGLCYLSLSVDGLEVHHERRRMEVIESVGVRIFISFVASLLIGGFVFTATLIQYAILRTYEKRSWALYTIGRMKTAMSRIPDDEAAPAPQQQQTTTQDFDIDWAVFDDAPADLKAAYEQEMKAAAEATAPLQIQHHLKSAKLLIEKMAPSPKLLIQQKLLMIEDQRSKN